MTSSAMVSDTYSGSAAPRMMFDRVKIVSYADCGMPIMSQMTLSGSLAATSSTKSPVPLPASRSSTIVAAAFCTSSSTRLSCFGVNADATILRRRAWRGSSMLIIDPKKSFMNSGRSPILVAPFPEQNSSGCRLTSRMSA